MSARSANPDAVVVGSGPYGVSVAAFLRHDGAEVRVFGDPMGSWRHNMPRGMFLKSTPSASNIAAPVAGYSLADFCVAEGLPWIDEDDPIPIDVFIRYGLWFQQRLVDVDPDPVVCVRRLERDFDVELESGDHVRTRNVVMANGHLPFTYIPPILDVLTGHEPRPHTYVSHSAHHEEFSRFAGRSVAVVGAGQSALQTAAMLEEAGARAHMLARTDRILWSGPPTDEVRGLKEKLLKPESPLGPGWSLRASHRGAGLIRVLPPALRLAIVRTVLGPSGAWWLRDRVDGIVDVQLATSITDATVVDDRVVLTCRGPNNAATPLTVDHVIAATGYRVDVDKLKVLDPALRRAVACNHGYPTLRYSFESSVAGLYFAGLSTAGTFGPLMRFVCGTDFAAPRIAHAIAAGNGRHTSEARHLKVA